MLYRLTATFAVALSLQGCVHPHPPLRYIETHRHCCLTHRLPHYDDDWDYRNSSLYRSYVRRQHEAAGSMAYHRGYYREWR